jgi:hypothetical protein
VLDAYRIAGYAVVAFGQSVEPTGHQYVAGLYLHNDIDDDDYQRHSAMGEVPHAVKHGVDQGALMSVLGATRHAFLLPILCVIDRSSEGQGK